MDRWYESAGQLVRGPDVEQLSHPPAVALMDGDLDRVEQLTNHLSDIVIVARGYVEPLRMAIADSRGHTLDPAKLERWRDAGMIYDELLEAILARAWARRGQPSRARQLLDRVRQHGFAPMYSPRGGAMAICCWAEAAAIVGDTAAAEELGGLLEPLAGLLVETGALVWDTIDRVRALLSLASGHPASAAEIATSAVAASRRRGTPIFLARERSSPLQRCDGSERTLPNRPAQSRKQSPSPGEPAPESSTTTPDCFSRNRTDRRKTHSD